MNLRPVNTLLNKMEQGRVNRFSRLATGAGAWEEELTSFTDAELTVRARGAAQRIIVEGETNELMAEWFAIVRDAARRTLGLRHHDVQITGGWALAAGNIAQMRTGEGKTLAATLAASLAALQGRGAFVVTVNDYLASRDAAWMRPVYELLGLTVGVVGHTMTASERRAAYACDITYLTNTSLGFDYLRDNLVQRLEDKVQREHYFALVDEVDNILLDEARTPLVIAGDPVDGGGLAERFAGLARKMRRGESPDFLGKDKGQRKLFVADYDFEADERLKTISLSERGVAIAEKHLGVDHLYQSHNGHLVNALNQALKAQWLMHRDRDYAVVDGTVQLIDQHTGRIMEGRRWQDGLHSAVEAKEGLLVQPEHPTTASVTYQNLFRGFERLSGMTGTVGGDAVELYNVYKIHTVTVPTHRPVQRVDHQDEFYASADGKWSAVERRVRELHATGQPLLIGTTSVEDSEMISAGLDRLGVPHQVLNARPELVAREAEIVAQAGRYGAVTVATNMAGRGVDIRLGGEPELLAEAELREQGLTPEDEGYSELRERVLRRWTELCTSEAARVRAAGGLFVLGTERYNSRRIDDQLAGRSGRQGDPGASLFLACAEDELLRHHGGERLGSIVERLGRYGDDGYALPIQAGVVTRQVRNAQAKAEQRHAKERKQTADYDDALREQRRVLYQLRDRVLAGGSLPRAVSGIVDLIMPEIELAEREHLQPEQLAERVQAILPLLETDPMELLESRVLVRRELLVEEVTATLENQLSELVGEDPDQREALHRKLLLHHLDLAWVDHLDDLDYLQTGIGLRGHAQLDPLVAYRQEAHELFSGMLEHIWHSYAHMISSLRRPERSSDSADDSREEA